MRPAHLILLLIGSVTLLVWGLWPAAPESDERRIVGVIDAMAAATRDRDVGDLIEHFSEKYDGELGDRDTVRRYAAGTFLRSDVLAVPSGVEVAVQGDRAQVSLRLTLAGSRAAGAGETLGSHLIDAEFVREGDAWRVVSAKRR